MSEPEKADRLDEIEELLLLAEETAERIERLQQSLLRSRIELLFAMLIGYGAMAVAAVGFIRWGGFYESPLLQSALLLATILILMGTAAFLTVRLRVSRQARRELAAESRISSDLLTMISSLTKDPEFKPSPVKRAILQMRLRRLVHTPERPS